ELRLMAMQRAAGKAQIDSQLRWMAMRRLADDGWRPVNTMGVEHMMVSALFPAVLWAPDHASLHPEVELCRVGERGDVTPSRRGRYNDMTRPETNIVDLWWRPVEDEDEHDGDGSEAGSEQVAAGACAAPASVSPEAARGGMVGDRRTDAAARHRVA